MRKMQMDIRRRCMFARAFGPLDDQGPRGLPRSVEIEVDGFVGSAKPETVGVDDGTVRRAVLVHQGERRAGRCICPGGTRQCLDECRFATSQITAQPQNRVGGKGIPNLVRHLFELMQRDRLRHPWPFVPRPLSGLADSGHRRRAGQRFDRAVGPRVRSPIRPRPRASALRGW